VENKDNNNLNSNGSFNHPSSVLGMGGNDFDYPCNPEYQQLVDLNQQSIL